ncbi:MAG: hypothetical protein K2M65_07725, partial [Muribaculaceae bacterium]|nr:hypothetical protein [Muribaculaceae bacterium]
YAAKKRNFRNYSNARFICYRRMLSNYPAMTKEQVEEYYKKIKDLVAQNEDIKREFDAKQRSTMYYFLANKRYREALPLIKKQFAYKYSRHNHGQMLRAMCTAAEACADSATLINAMSEYISYLEDASQSSSAEAYRELQIRYDISQLKAENARLELDRLDNQVKTDRLILGIALTATVLLIILILILANRYRKYKALRFSKPTHHE